MATVTVTFGKAGVASGGDIMQLISARTIRTESITPTNSNQETTITAEEGDSVLISALGADVVVAIGSSPDAASNGGSGVGAGGFLALGDLPGGWKVAVVTAS